MLNHLKARQLRPSLIQTLRSYLKEHRRYGAVSLQNDLFASVRIQFEQELQPNLFDAFLDVGSPPAPTLQAQLAQLNSDHQSELGCWTASKQQCFCRACQEGEDLSYTSTFPLSRLLTSAIKTASERADVHATLTTIVPTWQLDFDVALTEDAWDGTARERPTYRYVPGPIDAGSIFWASPDPRWVVKRVYHLDRDAGQVACYLSGSSRFLIRSHTFWRLVWDGAEDGMRTQHFHYIKANGDNIPCLMCEDDTPGRDELDKRNDMKVGSHPLFARLALI